MGWCSATNIFDAVIEGLLDEKADKEKIIIQLIETLEELDWDCQSSSKYIDHPIVRRAFIKTDQSWAEYFDERDRRE